MYRRYLIAMLVLLIMGTKLNAETIGIPGAEVPRKDSSGYCYIYKNYIVLLTAVERAIGEIITVYSRFSNDNACHAVSEESKILTVDGSGSTETFFGIYGHFLFTDSGTGPDGRGLGIYDLKKKKSVYYATYAGEEMKIENNVLVFYKDIKPKKKVKCTNVEKWREIGFDIGFEQKTLIYLDSSLREVATDEITCSPRQ